MPNSLVVIALVAMWLFVLLPMQAKRRPRIRQTTDAALATRVLDRDLHARQNRRGPATGHRSDPNWRPDPNRPLHAEDWMEAHARADVDPHDLDYDDPDLDAEYDDDIDRAVPRYDERGGTPYRRGRGGFDPEADAIARAARYAFRQRAVLGLVLAAIMAGALALIVSSTLWWACAAALLGTVGYLAYLRRQVQIEQEIRRRRMARLGRSRLGVESHDDEELRLVPSRLRRPGAVVLEVDDEDPVFDHLDRHDPYFDEDDDPGEVRRVVGQ
ncbi:gephyrin-like molybdotransferase receptor GlpR [Rhodococcus sp. NPDC058505]|uniref:divisome protein SepX/GlpR n=1 Tax=unclassified Rhodococcus (in: high G+C Gram-positive bacteria) TaxID=192944 RepID=UPI00366917D2